MKTFSREDLTEDLITIGDTGEQIEPWNYHKRNGNGNVFARATDKKEKSKTWNELNKVKEQNRRNPWGSIGEPETQATTTTKQTIIQGATSISGLSYSGEVGMYVAVTDSGLQPDWLRIY